MKYNRIIIVEPGLRDFHGHYFNIVFLLAEECRRRGLKYVIVANKQISEAVSSALPSRPVPHFEMGTYFGTSVDPLAGPIENYIDINRAFTRDLFLLTPHIRPDDLLIVPTAGERLMAAFAGWLTQLDAHRRPRCVLSFSFDPLGTGDPTEAHILRMLYRTGFNAIRRSRGRDWITMVSNSAIDEYSALAKMPIAAVPIAQPTEFVVRDFNQQAGIRLQTTFAYLGAAAKRKGFHILPEIITRTLSSRRDVRFFIQIYGYGSGDRPEGDLADTTAELEQLAERYPGAVRLRYGALPLFDFYSILGSVDVVLTAYSPDYDQISGIFHEAVAFGKPMVVRQGSATETAGIKHNAAIVPCSDHSAVSVAAAIEQAIRNIDSLQDKAAQASQIWHKHCGTGPYLDRIFEQCAIDDQNPTQSDTQNGEHVDDLVVALAHGHLPGLMVSLRENLHRVKAWTIDGDGTKTVPWSTLNSASEAVLLWDERARALQEEIARMRRSTSWRITKPLRFLGRLQSR